MSDGMENIHYLIEDAFVKSSFQENSGIDFYHTWRVMT